MEEEVGGVRRLYPSSGSSCSSSSRAVVVVAVVGCVPRAKQETRARRLWEGQGEEGKARGHTSRGGAEGGKGGNQSGTSGG